MRIRNQSKTPGTDLAAAIAGASGQPIDAVRALLGLPAAPPPELETTSRAPGMAHDRRVAVVAEGDRSEPGASLERPRARPLDPSGTRGGWVGDLQASGRGAMRPLDWTADEYAAAETLSRSPRAAARALCGLPPEYARRVELAALAYERQEDGRRLPTRTWCHVVARRIVALAVVLWRVSRSSRRRGMARIVVGRTRGMFASLFRNVFTGARLSISSLFATQHHDGASRWDCGDMVALARSGAIWKAQPPASSVAAAFRGKDRHGIARAFNEYHLTRRVAASSSSAEDPAALLERIDARAAELAELAELAPSGAPP